MFEIIPVDDRHILAFKVIGKLTDADYQAFLPELEKLIQEQGSISLYIELEDFQGWEAKAAWADLKFDLQHDKDFRRIAIVGDTFLEHSGIVLANFFTRSEMRFFSKDEAESAWDWLKENLQATESIKPVQPYRKILLAIDFSSHSERAALRALELSRCHEAKLEVLHVIEDPVFYTEADAISADIPLGKETLKEQAEERMREFAKRVGMDKDAILEVQWGRPKWAIVFWARKKGVDLVIVGSHGRHGVERLLGSVSSSVLHSSHCDVLVVKY